MATSKLKKCSYIVRLLQQKGPLTRKEVIRLVGERFIQEEPISSRTFDRYLDFIQEVFPCVIKCDNDYRYHIQPLHNEYGAKEEFLNYFTELYNVVEASDLLRKHIDRVYNADVITGMSYLADIMEAIDTEHGLEYTYESYTQKTEKRRQFIPYFVATWEGRWYLVAEATTHPGSLAVYALERMKNLVVLPDVMRRTINTTVEEFFRDSYGIQHAGDEKPVDILLKAKGSQRKYLRRKPIHISQKEVVDNDAEDFTIFTMHLVPCYNFYQQILRLRENVEILEPKEVRDEVRKIVLRLQDIYNKPA